MKIWRNGSSSTARWSDHSSRMLTTIAGISFAVVTCFVMTAISLAPSNASAADFKLKIGTMGLNDQQHDFLREFKKRVEADSK